MLKYTILIPLFFCMSITDSSAEKNPGTDKEKFSYSVGVQLAQNMLRQTIQVDTESFIQAIRDVLDRKELKLSIDEMQQILTSYQQDEINRQQARGIENKAAGEKFLADNKKNKDVVSLPNGLQYKILNTGSGNRPKVSDTVTVHYRGTLINGKEFDSSYRRGEPASINLNNVIKGWQQILPMMPTGSKWQIYIPSQLAYGEQGAGADIGPNSTLIFDIELISIN